VLYTAEDTLENEVDLIGGSIELAALSESFRLPLIGLLSLRYRVIIILEDIMKRGGGEK
jgi:hypothetical protein